MDNNSSENQVEKMQNRSDGPRTRRYALAGALFGILFPIVATLIKVWQSQLSIDLSNIIDAQRSDVLLWIIDTAPFFLGLFASFVGIQQDKLNEARHKWLDREKELNSIRASLEERVTERTNQLRRESELLRSSALIARSVAELQDVPTILERTVQGASDLLGFYHVAIYLFDEQRRMAFLQAASTDVGKKMVEDGFYIESDPKNVIGYISEQNKSYILTEANDESKTRIRSEGKLELTRSEIVIPLTVRGKIAGVLDFQSKDSLTLDQDEIEILQSLADQIAISIDGARLLDETQAFVNELEAVTTQQMGDVWKRYLANRALAYQYTASGVKSITPDQVKTKNKRDMQIPLRLRGQDIGVIAFRSKENIRWTASVRDVAEKVANQVVLALDNSRLLEETRRRATQQQTVNEISTRLNRSLDFDTLLKTAARELGSLPEVAEVSVVIDSTDENKQVSK